MDVTVIPDRANPVPLSTDMKFLQEQRDALLEALRKFRVASPPRIEGDGKQWDGDMLDDLSKDISAILQIDIRDWSQKNVKDLSQLADVQGRDRELLFKEVAKIVLLEGPDKQEFPKGLQHPRALISVLEALLTHHIFATVYPDPFFFLGEESSQVLNDIMSLGNIWNLGVAQRWRTDTLRLIRPLGRSPDEIMIRSESKKLLHKPAASGAANFMRSPAKYMIKDNPDALQKLEDLYLTAAEHSYKIWARAPMIKLLDASNFLGQPFDPQHRNMKAHDRVNQVSHINPTGQKISMVTSPAILRYGLHLADPDYYEKRWWHEVHPYRPAGVWFYMPRPGSPVINEQDFEPMPLPPRPVNDLVTANPPRSDLSPEALVERMLKRYDRVTLLDLVKPYLDDFAEKLRPVIEGLRGKVAQRIEQRNEMEKQRDEFRSKYLEALRP